MLNVRVIKHRPNFNLQVAVAIKPAFTAIFGPSGAGKTTILNLIAGLDLPSEGEIDLDGKILFSKRRRINLRPQRRNIGYIFQEGRLFPHLSVRANLEFGLNLTKAGARKFKFDEIVQATGVAAFLERTPDSLSGGEKQRVALARALLASPDYLLMDEPLAALDLSARLSFLKFLKDIHRTFKLPILYVSHDLSNVLNFADAVIILKEGKMMGCGSPYALLDKMAAPPLISREDIPNIFEATVTSHLPGGVTVVAVGDVTFKLPHLTATVGEKLLLNISASEIILAGEEPRHLSASNIFSGVISEIRYLGERVLVEVTVASATQPSQAVETGEHFSVEIVPATVERMALHTGKSIFLIIKAASFRRLG
jgi:molybdate transport system ATP-binding protein